MSRRLPIYFVLDVSESMIGDNLQNLESGMGKIVKSLRADAHALETVHIGIIAFAGVARSLVPLTELMRFYAPRLPVGSGTALGAALNLLMDELDKNLIKRSASQRGDYKPVVYLITDGRPTDDIEKPLLRWQKDYAQRVTLVALAMGEGADKSVLERLSEHVMLFDQDHGGDFDKFVRWLSMSISVQSQRADTGGISLAKPETGLSLWEGLAQASMIDTQVVLLHGKCSQKRQRYLIRFKRIGEDPRLGVMYQSTGSHALTTEYEEWSGDTGSLQPTISDQQLLGGAPCPHCGAAYGFAVCGDCGGVHCVKGDGEATCPHCGKVGHYGMSTGNEPATELQRGRG
jgi:uncharacterized protein YegL